MKKEWVFNLPNMITLCVSCLLLGWQLPSIVQLVSGGAFVLKSVAFGFIGLFVAIFTLINAKRLTGADA